MKNTQKWLLISTVLGLAVAAVAHLGGGEVYLAPLWFVGEGLRALSLASMAGNVISWAIVLVLSGAPVLYGLWRKCRKQWRNTDGLLILLSLQTIHLLYFLVNPSLSHYPRELYIPDGYALVFAGAWLATAIGYGILRLQANIKGTQLPQLLILGGCVLGFFTGYTQLALLIVRGKAVLDANTGDVSFTLIMLSVFAALSFLPEILGAITLLMSANVARSLMTDPYSEDTIALCAHVARRSGEVTVIAVGMTIFCNLMQLPMVAYLAKVNVTVELPLLTLLLSATLYLLCQYVTQAKALADDNDSII